LRFHDPRSPKNSKKKAQNQKLHERKAKTVKISAKSVAISPFPHHEHLNMMHVRKIKIRPDKTVPPETPNSTGQEK
jgi:hypothetical protein